MPRHCRSLLPALLALALGSVSPLAGQGEVPPGQPSTEEPAAAEAPPQPPAETEGEEPAAGDPPAEQPPAGEPAAATAEPPRREDRINFRLPFPEERGGGVVTGSAQFLDYQEENYAILTGDVVLDYGDLDMTAEKIGIDLGTKVVTAEGNVIIDQGPSRLTGSRAVYDLELRTGTIQEATAAVEGDFFFSGDEIVKVGAEEYELTDGMFTSCRGEVPAWSFHVGTADIELEDYARVKHTSMRVRQVPVLYIPYLVWPTKTERSSGLLVPKIGSNNDRGAYLGLAYYHVLGRSYDTTMFLDLWSEQFFAVGNELRYHPSETTIGRFQGYAIEDPERNEWRWKVSWDHETRSLPFDMRGVVHYEDFSDFQFFRDFERQLLYKAKDSIYSRAFATGNWGNHSLNLLLDERQNFAAGDYVVELAQLPEIEYNLRPTPIFGLPVYLSMKSGAHYLSVDRSPTYQGEYGRFELFPTVKVPVSGFSWLSASVTAGGQLTWYGDSVDFASGGTRFRGEALTRVVPVASAEIIGPSFSRIFDRASGAKVKHIVEPRFEYGFVDDYDDQRHVPVFDEVDPLSSRDVGTVGLVNRVLAKPAPEEGEEAAELAREVLAFELFRRYSFDAEEPLESGAGEESAWGPLEAVLRAYPSEDLGLRLDARYSPLFGRLTSVRLNGNVALGPHRLDVGWSPRWQAATGETTSNQAMIGARLQLLERLTLASTVNYDLERDVLQDQRHFLTWYGSCYTFKLELHESRTADQRRRDYLFSIDLKNVGTFLDLTGGEQESF